VNEAIFPLLGPLLVVAVALPASALAAKAVLFALSRLEPRTGLPQQSALRYALIVASSAAPLAWFLSAGLHQAESGERLIICAARGAHGGVNLEAIGFSMVLSALIVGLALPILLRERGRPRAAAPSADSALQLRRIDELLAGRPALHALRGMVAVDDACATPIATAGVVAPRVLLRTSFARALDDEALCAALHHELEHLRGQDPLRYFLVRWALAVNPLGRVLLRDELARWVLARELHCDRAAVVCGASAPALAQALVSAARPPPREPQPALGAAHADAIRLRVGLLLAYADRRPHATAQPWSLRPAVAFLGFVLVLVLPHHASTLPLDTIHRLSERAVARLAGH
jgi:hypothetical protein